MSEVLTLTAPIIPSTINNYKLVHLSLDIENQLVIIVAKSDTGVRKTRIVEGITATSLMSILNTANLSIKSLQRRALEYMVSQGDFIGVVSGIPD